MKALQPKRRAKIALRYIYVSLYIFVGGSILRQQDGGRRLCVGTLLDAITCLDTSGGHGNQRPVRHDTTDHQHDEAP